MNRQSEPRFPNRLAFVLKVRADATREALTGRLENLVTARRLEFASAGELLDAIAREIETSAGDTNAD